MAEQLLFNDNNVHHLAYKCIIDWKPIWDMTTNKYKGFIMYQLRYYTEQETGRTRVDGAYRHMYDKYIKYYNHEK